MHTYFVTTGVSMSDMSRCWRLEKTEPREKKVAAWPDLDDFHATSSLREMMDLDANRGATYFACMHHKRCQVIKALGETRESAERSVTSVIENLLDDCWSPGGYERLPAELATLYKLFESDANGVRTIQPEDRIVFLYGRNVADAVFCRHVLRREAEKHELLNDPAKQITLHEKQFNWDPVSQSAFTLAMAELWDVMAPIDAHRLVLTGGYKGVLLDLAVRRGRADHGADCIYYLHENSVDLIRYEPTQRSAERTATP